MSELVTFLLANGDSASGVGPKHTSRVLRLGLSHNPTVVLACELANLPDPLPTRLGAYDWARRGAAGSPASAVAIGWNKTEAGPITDVRMRVASRATSEGSHVTGRGIRDRPILGGRLFLWAVRGRPGVAVFHAAPPRAPIANAVGLARLATFRAKFKGGDLNRVQRGAARALGRKVAGGGVLWLTIPRRWEVSYVQMLNVGAEHLWPLITVRRKPPRRRKRR